ncbi:MAG: hypothetical protein JSR80_07220 [Verrucomicrobia bacterium]|nr:hypothetical protein [Verrucomicrobiota bacterium]
MSISPTSPEPYKSQAPAPAAPAAPAPGNTDSASGVIAMLQKLIEEFKAQLEKGNISLTQMNSLIKTIGTLQKEMAELVGGTLTPKEAEAMLTNLKNLYNQCKAFKGAMGIWKALEKQFDTALAGANGKIPTNLLAFSILLTGFMKNPSELTPNELQTLASEFSQLSGIAQNDPAMRNLVNAFAASIDEAMSAGDNLSQQLSTMLSQITNMIEELAKAQGQIEQKFYQTLMQQIKLAQP